MPNSNTDQEKRAIVITMIGDASMAFLGLSFSVFANSDAILIDGLYTTVNVMVTLIALRIVGRLASHGDKDSPFGYAIYEPLINLMRGLLIGTVVIMAVFSALDILWEGGRDVEANWAIIYSALAAGGCFLGAFYLRNTGKKIGSTILLTDSKQWLTDGLLSAVLGISFVAALMLEANGLQRWANYVDPIMTLFLALLLITTPVSIIRENWHQILGRSVSSDVYTETQRLLGAALEAIAYEASELKMTQIGRLYYIRAFVIMAPSTPATPEMLDAVRQAFYERLSQQYPSFSLNLSFTADRVWVQRTITNAY
jgi:cation diffusion facilitator family transporter